MTERTLRIVIVIHLFLLLSFVNPVSTDSPMLMAYDAGYFEDFSGVAPLVLSAANWNAMGFQPGSMIAMSSFSRS